MNWSSFKGLSRPTLCIYLGHCANPKASPHFAANALNIAGGGAGTDATRSPHSTVSVLDGANWLRSMESAGMKVPGIETSVHP